MIAVPSRMRYRLFVASLLLLLAMPLGVGVAQEQANNEAIAQGFGVEGNITDFVGGVLVSTKENNPQVVQLAARQNVSRLAGVVSERPLVALSNQDAKLQVATSGTIQVLVSDINGSIRAGDKVTASPIEGVGMLATGSDQVVGTAQGGLNPQAVTTQTVKDSTGNAHTVRLGRVAMQVGVSYYQAPSSGIIPPFVQGFANTIAGRPVSFLRIAVCSIILLIAAISSTVLLYASVRSGLISLGRNPMAAGAIRRGLLQVGAAIILIMGLVLLASYIILTV